VFNDQVLTTQTELPQRIFLTELVLDVYAAIWTKAAKDRTISGADDDCDGPIRRAGGDYGRSRRSFVVDLSASPVLGGRDSAWVIDGQDRALALLALLLEVRVTCPNVEVIDSTGDCWRRSLALHAAATERNDAPQGRMRVRFSGFGCERPVGDVSADYRPTRRRIRLDPRRLDARHLQREVGSRCRSAACAAAHNTRARNSPHARASALSCTRRLLRTSRLSTN
jgi:hypothetical protein